MTKDEALKMAIELIENPFVTTPAIKTEVLNACKEALEQLEQEVKCSNHPNAPHGFCRDASHIAGRYVCECEGWQVEQPAQEPVGWMLEWKEGEFDYWHKHVDEDKLTLEMWFDAIRLTDTEYKIYPLYTHPHQDKTSLSWQGLTNDEIVELAIDNGAFYDDDIGVLRCIDMSGIEFARAIEQALKDKNT